MQRTLDKSWWPSFDYYNELKKALLNQCIIDGKGGIKKDKRSNKYAKAFISLEKNTKENAIPFNWFVIVLSSYSTVVLIKSSTHSSPHQLSPKHTTKHTITRHNSWVSWQEGSRGPRDLARKTHLRFRCKLCKLGNTCLMYEY